MSGWLTSWKTFATLAVLGVVYLVWVLLLGTPINWGNVATGVLLVASCTPLAVMQRRARGADHKER